MSDLNDEARSLFDAARAGYEPNDAERKRVLSRVLLRAGVAVGVTTAASAAGAPLAGAATSSGVAALAFKGALWVAIVGSLSVGGYALSRVSTGGVGPATTSAQARASRTSMPSPSGSAPSTPRALDVTPKAALSASPQKPEALRPNVSRPTSVPRPRAFEAVTSSSAAFPSALPSEATPTPSPAALTLSVEARGLAEVQRDLKEGRNEEALRLVEEQRRQFAHGELQPERDAAKIVALCAVGRVAEAQAAARTFLANAPRSPFAARIRASCAGK